MKGIFNLFDSESITRKYYKLKEKLFLSTNLADLVNLWDILSQVFRIAWDQLYSCSQAVVP